MSTTRTTETGQDRSATFDHGSRTSTGAVHVRTMVHGCFTRRNATRALTRRGAHHPGCRRHHDRPRGPARGRRGPPHPPRAAARPTRWPCPTACAPRASPPGPGPPTTSARSPTAGSSPATCSRGTSACCCRPPPGARCAACTATTAPAWSGRSAASAPRPTSGRSTPRPAPSWPTSSCPAASSSTTWSSRGMPCGSPTPASTGSPGSPWTGAVSRSGAAPTFLPLTGEWPAYDGTNINANGIRAAARRLPRPQQQHRRWTVARRPAHRGDHRDRGARRPGAGRRGRAGAARAHALRRARQRPARRCRCSGCPAVGTAGSRRGAVALTDETLDVPSTATWAAGRCGRSTPASASPRRTRRAYWITRLSTR